MSCTHKKVYSSDKFSLSLYYQVKTNLVDNNLTSLSQSEHLGEEPYNGEGFRSWGIPISPEATETLLFALLVAHPNFVRF